MKNIIDYLIYYYPNSNGGQVTLYFEDGTDYQLTLSSIDIAATLEILKNPSVQFDDIGEYFAIQKNVTGPLIAIRKP